MIRDLGDTGADGSNPSLSATFLLGSRLKPRRFYRRREGAEVGAIA